jgi:Cytochrome P450
MPMVDRKNRRTSSNVSPALHTQVRNFHFAQQKFFTPTPGHIAGADTVSTVLIGIGRMTLTLSQTTAVIEIAILAMTLFPQAQRKAQAEIDKVLGNQRLPDYGDRNSLPYCEAFYREVNRWHPANPIGIA